MKKRTWKKGLAVMLGLVLGIHAPMGTVLPSHRVFAYTARSATINASSLNVRSGPGTGHSAVTKLARGAAVTVINETTGSDGRLWYQIQCTGSGGAAVTGYVLSTYVKFPVSYSHNSDFEAYLNQQGFPDSYKDGLRQLHAQYPNWVFTAQHTGLDWNTVIQNESVLGRNLVHTGSISSYKSLVDGAYNWDDGTWTGFDGSTWVAASEDIIRYYMDPRNFLDEASVFQFLSQEYDGNLHTKEGLQSMLNGTFMEGGLKTYSGGTSTGSGGSNGSSGGPGVSGGSSGSHSSGVITAGQSGGGSKNPTEGSNSGNSGNGGTSSAPTGGSQQIQFGAPQASISPHKTALVGTATMIPSGPPIDSGKDQNGGSAAVPGGGAAVTPGGGTSQEGNSSQGSNSQGSAVVTPGGGASGTPGGNTSQNGSSQGSAPVVTPGGQGPASGNGNGDSSAQTSRTYADVIMDAAGKSGVNPYVIAAMIMQEQGRDGRGNSISGNYGGYTGYYNYFNVGAYASDGMGAVVRGLWYASQSGNYGRPWNSVESSIIGGAQFYGTNYVNAGQDTLYLKKYNVQGSNKYKHQYMTNVDGAAAEGRIFAEGVSAAVKKTALQFKIPVYQNMPGAPCAKPTVSGSPNNKLRGLGAEGFALTPTFQRDTTSYDLIVDHSVSNVTIYANAIDGKATVSGTGNIQLQSGVNEIPVTVRAENGSERKYVIHIVRQAGGPTYNAGMNSGSGTGTVTPGDGSSGGPGVVGPGTGGPGASNGNSGGSGSTNPGGGASGSPAGGSNVVTPGGNNVTIISPAG